MEILEHLAQHTTPVTHPQFDYLFFYSISRNQALAGLARKVLEPYFAKDRSYLAFRLTQMPKWVQLAFIEGGRRQMTPIFAKFLSELKKNTINQEVIEEINGTY